MMPNKNNAHALNQRQTKVLFGLVTFCIEGHSSANDEDGLKYCMVKMADQSAILA